MENIVITQSYKSPVGELVIGSFKNKICLCDWHYRKMRIQIDQRICAGLNAQYHEGYSEINEATIAQLEAYFAGSRKEFEIPLTLVGTTFQKMVWHALLQIPYGHTCSYLELSKQLNNPKAIRAVASANGANAIAIIVPCHRILGSDGKLVGYAGGLPAKKKLLQLETSLDDQQLHLFE